MIIGVVIQARSSSTRLPDKVLLEMPYGSGITVLQQVIRRVKKAKLVNSIIIATTIEPEDERIVDIANLEGVKYSRGSKENVLERYYFAAKENNLDIVLRITSDCPCIDPEQIDEAIRVFQNLNIGYVSNSLERTFMHGLDIEVFSFKSLENAYLSAVEDYDLEHVTPYIKKVNTMHNIVADGENFAPDIRITLDTPEDYAFLLLIYDFLYYNNNIFPSVEIVKLIKQKPWLKLINKTVVQKRKINSMEDEIAEAIKILELQGLKNAAIYLKKYHP